MPSKQTILFNPLDAAFNAAILSPRPDGNKSTVPCPLCGKVYTMRPDSILMHLKKKHRVLDVTEESRRPGPIEVPWAWVRQDVCGCGCKGVPKRYRRYILSSLRQPTSWMFEHLRQQNNPAQHIREAAVTMALAKGV